MCVRRVAQETLQVSILIEVTGEKFSQTAGGSPRPHCRTFFLNTPAIGLNDYSEQTLTDLARFWNVHRNLDTVDEALSPVPVEYRRDELLI